MGQKLCTNRWKSLSDAHLLKGDHPQSAVQEIDRCRKAALLLSYVLNVAWKEYFLKQNEDRTFNKTGLTQLSAVLTQTPSRHCHWTNLANVDKQLFNIFVLSHPNLSCTPQIYYTQVNQLFCNHESNGHRLADHWILLVRREIILPYRT